MLCSWSRNMLYRNGEVMKMVKYMRRVWHAWREMWRFRWEDLAGPDSHRWESKMETQRRLRRPPHEG